MEGTRYHKLFFDLPTCSVTYMGWQWGPESLDAQVLAIVPAGFVPGDAHLLTGYISHS